MKQEHRELASSLPTLRRFLLMALLVPSLVHALNLGDIEVRSRLDQPLEAQIPLRVEDAKEAAGLQIQLAPQTYFDFFGITRSPIHDELRFTVEQRGADWFVRVFSQEALHEPHLSFPLRAEWPGGEVVRDYTVFIEPQVQPRPVKRAPPAAQKEPSQPTNASLGDYGPVRRGETLWQIASHLKPPDVSTEQMAMALLRANPEAFPDGNVNYLIAGTRLKIPGSQDILADDQHEARQAFRAQMDAWRGDVRTPTQGPVVSTTPDGSTADQAKAQATTTTGQTKQPDKQPSELRILAKQQQEPAAATRQKDIAEIQKKVLLTLEATEANRLEFSNLSNQVGQLQEQLTQLRQLLLLKEKQVQALRAAKTAPEPAKAIAPPKEQSATAEVTRRDRRPLTIERPVNPSVEPDQDFLVQWWLLLIAALLAMAGLVIGILFARFIETRARSDTATSVSAERPYAAAVARYARDKPRSATTSSSQSQAPAGTPATPQDRDTVTEAQAASDTDSDLDEILDIRGLDLHKAHAPVSDEEIASWVSELSGDAAGDRDGDSSSLSKLGNNGVDEDFTAQLKVLPGEEQGADDDAELEATSLMQELLEDPDSRLQAQHGMEVFAHHESDEDPEAVDLKLELARAYLEIGDTDGARDILGEVVAHSPSSEQRDEAKQLLASLR